MKSVNENEAKFSYKYCTCKYCKGRSARYQKNMLHRARRRGFRAEERLLTPGEDLWNS